MSGGHLTSELEVYADNIRVNGASEMIHQKATSRTAKIIQYLEYQDAPRNCSSPSQIPGPWCGCFIVSVKESVMVYISQQKWDKAKLFVTQALEKVTTLPSEPEKNDPKLDYKCLEKGGGFLVYFCRTYTSMVPYLKGLCLTLKSWCHDRDYEG